MADPEEQLQEMLRVVARRFGGTVQPPEPQPIISGEDERFQSPPPMPGPPFNREMPQGFQSSEGPNLGALNAAPPPPAPAPPPQMGANQVPFTPMQGGMLQDVSGYGRVQGGYDKKAKSINMRGLEGPQVADRSVTETLPGRQEVMNFAARIGLDTSRPGVERETLPKLLAYREQHGKLGLTMAQTQQALERANLAHQRALDDPSQARDALASLREFKLAKEQLDLAEEELINSPERGIWGDLTGGEEPSERVAAKGKVAKAKEKLSGITGGEASAEGDEGIVISSEAELTPDMLGKTVTLNGEKFKVSR
jgi:hypothetical protein